jgi:PAS domain S-box-containing protein
MLEPIREAADFTLYRGRQHGDPSPVLAVALAAEQPSPQGLKRLEHEYSFAAELDPAWAAKPLAITRHEGRTILILTDPGGEPLDLLLERDLLGNQGQPLDLTRVLCIAIGLAKAIGQVHRHGLIHKDIKPANVLVDDAGHVCLTGFGIASRLPHERQAPAPPEIIAGTLAYMAPEQTGRMNRSMDSRSDLYSLGVTLYQMLTGMLPFSAADPLGWVHCHIARQPTPPSDRAAVPEPLSAMIMKLLAKNAEERYQTASGLEADLRQCLADWQSHGRIDPFPLGAHDSPDRLLIPEKLYGREREVDVLLATFDRVVAQGTAELVFISGYSGVGKSSLVNELHKVLVPPRGLFAAGKFDQYKRDIPYATLAEAFQILVRQILVKSEGEVNQWRRVLAEAVGPNGQLIVSLIPEVEVIIGKQPPVPDLSPQDTQNRFQMVFRRFLGAFARPEHPLALFLDDLQWLDAATLELLEHLTTDSDVRHLMLVGAYRDHEVSASHPLPRTLEAIRKAGARMQEIVLAPLGLDDVGRLIADALHCEGDSGHPLAKLVYEKTGGNPFFAIQFLRALAEEGLLGFDSVTRTWQWDMNRIRAKSYTDNVVDLISGKLRRLSAPTQEALKLLASLGNAAEAATLAVVHGETEVATHAALWEAVRAGLIFQQESTYKFLHDRIQQAAYSLIPEERRAEVHLSIGRVLLASLTAEELAEQLFEVANQFNRSTALLVDRTEKADIATLNLRTGRKAKASAAYASARTYFASGIALFDEQDWGIQHDLIFSLFLECAECELLCGGMEKAAQLIAELLRRAASDVESDLRRGEAFLAQGQSISRTGSFGWSVLSGEIYWSEETHNIFEHEPRVKPTLEFVFQRIHPGDRDLARQALDNATNEETDFDIEHRLLMPDGSLKHIHVVARALKTSSGGLEFVGAVIDVTAAKQAEMKLRASEAYLAEAQRLSHTGSWAWNPATGENRYWSDECFRLMGFDPAGGMPPFETVARRFHPDDQPIFAEKLERARRERAEFEMDYRIIHPGGEIREIHAVGHPVLGPSGDLIEFVGSLIDVTERKQAEDNIRQSENELRHILDSTPQQVAVLGPDRARLYLNQATLDYFGLTLDECRSLDHRKFFHPDDWERMMSEAQSKFLSGLPHEAEFRLLRKDGKYRWFLFRYSPLRDEQGRLRRWYVAGTDIEDRKEAEQRLQIENVALREEIDRASMFEQIVGASPPLRNVLSRVSKVAPTDSSVLITGETGTGKELVARAIHKRSRRSSRAFVSVNCAAVPRDLIASELFGHEKGAFTGATQRRLGRFELAEGGTIFLDEVGELPAETQIALLRVLQEREFERVGGTGSIRTNVRVIAATNRVLEAAIDAGTFRSDLFYRLNVFPIEMPSLRERREDVPLLVEYFIDRFARQAGKSFQAVNKKSLDLLQSYPWPGNIRELQNVIERSVIVCESENFSVDESWLSRQPPVTVASNGFEPLRKLPSREKEIIEAALSESGGRVYGPSGAAAKLGIPRSTLEHKIRSLKIDKKRFKTAVSP